MSVEPEGITLVLGGLGVRGAANIGVLQILREQRVKIKKIVATGISSIIGAHFARGGDLEELTERFVHFFTENHRYLWGLERLGGLPPSRGRWLVGSLSYFLRESLFCKVNLKRPSLLPWELVEGNLKELFGNATSSELEIPLAISAIDLARGEEVLLERGRLVELVQAGIAFPGLFPPVRIAGREFSSSILYCELPLEGLGEEDRPIVAVDIPGRRSSTRPRSLLEIIAQVDELRRAALKRRLLTKADRVFCLEGLRRFPWGNYRRIPALISRARGEAEVLLSVAM